MASFLRDSAGGSVVIDIAESNSELTKATNAVQTVLPPSSSSALTGGVRCGNEIPPSPPSQRPAQTQTRWPSHAASGKTTSADRRLEAGAQSPNDAATRQLPQPRPPAAPPRRSKGAKAPRKEYERLRRDPSLGAGASPSSVGAEYSKIVSDLRRIDGILNGNAGFGENGKEKTENTPDGYTTQQRLEKIEKSAKSDGETQLCEGSTRNYNVLAMVASEIEMRERRLEERKMQQRQEGKPSGDLEEAEEILKSVKSSSTDLNERLVVAIGQASEEKREGSPEARSALTRVNGSRGGFAVSSEGNSLRNKKSVKSLRDVRLSYENKRRAEAASAASPLRLPSPSMNKIQFLANQPGQDKKDIERREAFDSGVLDRIASVPLGDAMGLEQVIASMKDDGRAPSLGKARSSSYPASSGAMGAEFPTMALPMFRNGLPLPGLEKELEKSPKKHKKGKKRGREKSVKRAGSEPHVQKERGREKSDEVDVAGSENPGFRKRGRERSAEGSTEGVAPGNESSRSRKRGREKKVDGGIAGEKSSVTKKKRSRGRKSEIKRQGPHEADQMSSAETAAATTTSETDVPPPLPVRPLGKSPRTNTRLNQQRPRRIPSPAPRPRKYNIVTDQYPRRVHNPLLRLPQFPDGPSNPGERLNPLEIPQAGELWNLADMHFGIPDTYPVSYLARMLGFDVPEEGVGQEFGASFDPATVGRLAEGDDNIVVGPAGKEDCGVFSNKIFRGGWRNCSEGDDLNLSYCDPLWANILSLYQGYDEEDFKDAGKGFHDVLSLPCLEFARERLGAELVGMDSGGGVSFRFAKEGDEASLESLAERCRWKSRPRHDLSSCLRSQSHFCIIAESLPLSPGNSGSSGSRRPIAFIQYRFCWYRVEEKKVGNVSTDKISELVIFIDSLVYADCGVATGGEGEMETTATTVLPKELETAKVLLTSLALVHAARVGIWYGMTQPPLGLVPFLSKYFRMSNVGGDKRSSGGDETSSDIPLVLDIKKCHYKYAILLLEESLKSQALCRGRDCDLDGERMIVHLRYTPGTAEASARWRGCVFSNSNVEARSKRAHIRMVRGPNAELFSVSTSAGEGEKKEALNPIDPSSIDISADWSVMRSFSLQRNSGWKRTEGNQKPDLGEVSKEIFLAELEKKQKELRTLESSIETTSRQILSKAYGEHLDYTTGDHRARMEREKKVLKEYEAVQTRLQEAELAWQAQLDQDMDAVCDVCCDGEVTPDNQIIFCDACNVAVHQGCYGIDHIPSGNFFCHTCTYFEVDKEFLAARRRDGPPVKLTRQKVVCELCPRRQGAFVQVQTLAPTKKAKWVHVGCAKWQGMQYVNNESKDKIEDLTLLKEHFKAQGSTCTLCKSGIGALHPCRVEGCGKWLHLTCARSLGKCSVQHGENCEGFYDPEMLDNPPWTLACPKHSEIDPESVREGSLSAEQLVAIAESYPPEPAPLKPFSKMNATERKEYLSDKDNLEEFLQKVTRSLDGAKCDLCDMPADPSIDKRCDKCGTFSHADCADPARGDSATCLTCRFTEENIDAKEYEEPRCHMCKHPNRSGGPLVRSFAKPVSMKAWKGNPKGFKRSTFGNNKFCHALCGMWNPHCETGSKGEHQEIVIDFSQIAMSNGRDYVSHQYRCTLCGLKSGAKADCSIDGCVAPGGSKTPCKFHVTCARQAGLEVLADDFTVKCYNHVNCTFVFRARLEDLREIELNRFSSKTFKPSNPITWSHASSLFHAAVDIMRTLGWAWRWAEWWVDSGDNWEPLLEEGQIEADMTEEELKIVKSTPESRCQDARKCRLAAFGAALRNRDYDREDGDDQEPLERALTAILSTPSLVGPLKKKEIEFFVTWLALGYRSKSPILGFGDHKAPVATDYFCIHQDDGTPKYELGTRPLPGKAKPQKGVFEPTVEEVDDFLKIPLPHSPKKTKKKKKKSNEAPDIVESADSKNDQEYS